MSAMNRMTVLVGVVCVFLSACSKGKTQDSGANAKVAPVSTAPSAAQAGAAQQQAGVVIETMNSGGYTYVKLESPQGQVWAAGPEISIKVGDKVEFAGGTPMTQFHSKSLDRSFEVIYFVPGFTINGAKPSAAKTAMPAAPAAPAAADIKFDGLTKPEGGKTVAEVFAEKATLGGKEVLLRGKVVKFNGGIMGRNWLHIQDGTGAAGSNDLTVTTDSIVAVGDTVLVKGTVSLDKDFGGGYKFGVILDNATVTKE